MNLPPSALLGRLQAFLPEMEKANKATERLLADGKLDVIDANLQVATGHQRGDESAEETDNEEVEGEAGEEDAEEEEDEDGPETGGAAGADSRTVELDFALGDFDDNPIAKLEEEKETEEVAAASEHQQDAEQVADAEMLRLPGSSFTGSRKEKGKPLIEEL
ncbi:unnamed protein product [Sphacelaria rigidula]